MKSVPLARNVITTSLLMLVLALAAACATRAPTSPDATGPSGATQAPSPVLAGTPSQTAGNSVERTTASSAPERVKVETTSSTRHYTVYGSNSSELFAFIDAYGPVDDKGARAVGLTHYQSRLDWRSSGDPRACAISTMTIVVTLEVILPELDNPARLPTDLQAKWRTFSEGVAAHEQRHVDIYLRGAATIKDRMAALQPVAGCSNLESQVNSTWNGEQQNSDAAQERFHDEERARIEVLRAPVKSQIDGNNARLTALSSQIASMDTALASLSGQVNALREQLDSLKAQFTALEDRYRGQPMPAEVRQQYDALVGQYNGLVPRFNSAVDQFNGQLSQRASLAAQFDALSAQTRLLVDQFNWTR